MMPGTLALIIFFIEFIFLVIIVLKNRTHPYFLTIAGLLVLLQVYQLSEFLICVGISENITARIAYVVITFLPPLGYYLSTQLVGWKHKDYFVFFAAATGFSLYYAIWPRAIYLVDCNPLYATYGSPLHELYGYYYIFVVCYAILFLLLHLLFRREKFENKYSVLLLIGYLSFLVPMQLMVMIDFSYIYSTTSIMCKYAFLLAVSLFIFSFLKPNVPIHTTLKIESVEEQTQALAVNEEYKS